MNPVADFLAATGAFGTMSRLELEALSAFLGERRVASGSIVFSMGDTGTEFYIVRSGLVGMRAPQADGVEVDTYEFGPGRFFGEMAIVEGLPRSATCYARVDSELLVLEGIDFYRLVWDHPVIGAKLLASMRDVMRTRLAEATGILSDLVKWGESARRRTIVDEASGLFNRRYLDENLDEAVRRGTPCSLLMLDIDRFREVNAAWGLAAGDAAIASTGAALQSLVRENDVAAHLSGDEFALLLRGAGKAEALAVAERARAVIEGLWLEFRTGRNAAPVRLRLTGSIGVSSLPDDAKTAEGLLSTADDALARAKEKGRNRVEAAGRR